MRGFTGPVLLAALCAASCVNDEADAAEGIAKPHQLIVNLQRRMYVVGETSGRLDDFAAAERQAAADIRRWVNGFQGFLVEKNAAGQVPLMVAASLGYAEVVGELLKAKNVRDAIDGVDGRGLSAWIHANFAFRQTLWVCNPSVFEDPFAWVPLAVTLPYYQESADNPYRKIRRLLEEAGAKADRERAKRFWQDNCTRQAEGTRAKVEASDDLLETVLAEGDVALRRLMAGQRRSPDRSERPR
jgi:hypothetical protein